MAPRLVLVAGIAPRPWRNGGGSARDLLALPPGDAWQAQVGLAGIDVDGPFSHYPGVERCFAIVAGAGVDLDVDGTSHRVTPAGEPLRFDGGASTGCRLVAGPAQALNLLLRGARGALRRAVDGAAWRPEGAQCGVFAVAAGTCRAAEREFELPAQALLWFDVAPAELVYTTATAPAPAAAAWWITVTAEGASS